MRAMKWIALLSLVLAGAAAAHAATRPSTPLEASMLVTGHVLIEPDGSVSNWELDHADKLPAVVTGLVGRAALTWRFEPVVVEGQARRARASMSLRVVASQLQGDEYRVVISGAHFGKDAKAAAGHSESETSDAPRIVSRKQPIYPAQALDRGFRGSVYVLLRIGRDGEVRDAIAEQVNLRTRGTPGEMSRMRDILARSALAALREWTFEPPTTGEQALRDEWTGRIAVDYLFHGESGTGHGEWHAYYPGPRMRAPWLQAEDVDMAQSPDTMVAGGFQPIGSGLKLLTPLQGG